MDLIEFAELRRSKRYDEGITRAQEILHRDPNNLLVLQELDLLYNLCERYEAAEETALRVVQTWMTQESKPADSFISGWLRITREAEGGWSRILVEEKYIPIQIGSLTYHFTVRVTGKTKRTFYVETNGTPSSSASMISQDMGGRPLPLSFFLREYVGGFNAFGGAVKTYHEKPSVQELLADVTKIVNDKKSPKISSVPAETNRG